MPTNVITTVTSDAMQMLQMTHQFYNDEWHRLLTQMTIAIGLVGTAVAIINYALSKVERNKIKNAQILATNQIEAAITASKAESDKIKSANEEEIKRLENTFNKFVKDSAMGFEATNGTIYYLQAMNLYREKMFASALFSFTIAVKHYLNANIINPSLVFDLPSIAKDMAFCLQQLKHIEIEQHQLSESINDALKVIKAKNDNGVYTAIISSLEHELEAAKIRK